MNGAVLKPYKVYLRRRGGQTRSQQDVQAAGQQHAERLAVKQAIAATQQKTRPAHWIVTAVEDGA